MQKRKSASGKNLLQKTGAVLPVRIEEDDMSAEGEQYF